MAVVRARDITSRVPSLPSPPTQEPHDPSPRPCSRRTRRRRPMAMRPSRPPRTLHDLPSGFQHGECTFHTRENSLRMSTGSSGASSSITPARTCGPVFVHTNAARRHLIRASKKGRCVTQHGATTTTEDKMHRPKCHRRTDYTDTSTIYTSTEDNAYLTRCHESTFPRLHSSSICSGAREKHRRNRRAGTLDIVIN